LPSRPDAPILIALGANLPIGGQLPAQTLRRALAALPEAGLAVCRQSRLFATPCFPPGSGPDYVNAAAEIAAPPGAAPAGVLARLHAVEASFHRHRGERWGQRTLDLDLLAFGDRQLPDPATAAAWRELPAARQRREAPDRLILPHPRLQDRAFVLVPLAEVAAGWRHPGLGCSVAELVARLPAAERAAIRPLP
jgi:2-amino-4-hydroxy-6-hydroxymethyldihydropteridine diphosphokinase